MAMGTATIRICVLLLATLLLGQAAHADVPVLPSPLPAAPVGNITDSPPKPTKTEKLRFKKAKRREDGAKNFARIYRDVHATKGVLHKSVYESFKIPVSNAIERYRITTKIGEGTYARTFRAWDTLTNRPVVVKAVIPPLSTWRVKREIKILTDLQGGENVIQLVDLVMHSQTKLPAMVMDYYGGTLSSIAKELSPDEVKYYSYELLKGIDYIHSKGYMHRDIKMTNVLVNHSQRDLRIIDFNVAERYQPGELYTMYVMSCPYRAPELMVDLEDYDYSLDMWGFGVVMAKFIIRDDDWFDSADDEDHSMLHAIIKVLGTEKFDLWLQKYGLELDPELRKFIGTWPAKPWPHLVNQENYKFANAVSLDLLDKLLRYDQATRLTAKEAMAHPYFADLHQPQPQPPPTSPSAPSRLNNRKIV